MASKKTSWQKWYEKNGKSYYKKYAEKNRKDMRQNYRNWRSKKFYDGKREEIIQRDGEKCVKCSMNREDHWQRWHRDLGVDHIDGLGTGSKYINNSDSNLQTLCLPCHTQKDIRIEQRKLTLTNRQRYV